MNLKIYPKNQVKNYLMIDVFLLVFFVYRLSVKETAFNSFAMWSLFALFVFCFYICLWYCDWRLVIANYVGYTSLLILAIYVDVWLLLYGFMLTDLLGRAQRRMYLFIGVIGVLLMYGAFNGIQTGNIFHFVPSMLLPFFIVQLFIPFISQIRYKAKALQEKLNIANHQLNKLMLEEERHRIARDLHDSLGQTLTMIKMKTELTIKIVEKDEVQAREELNDILKSSRVALKQVRELVSEMKYVSLSLELNKTATTLEAADIQLVHCQEKSLPLLSNTAETMFALSLREVITNILKHSLATRCEIVEQVRDDMYTLEIKDNGIGGWKKGHGNGVQSIRERMALIQGTMSVTSKENVGTTIILQGPVHLHVKGEQR